MSGEKTTFPYKPAGEYIVEGKRVLKILGRRLTSGGLAYKVFLENGSETYVSAEKLNK